MVFEALPVEPASRALRAGDLVAEYATTQSARTGEWVAVGTVRREEGRQHGPIWVLVGAGISESRAVDALQQELEHAARRITASI